MIFRSLALSALIALAPSAALTAQQQTTLVTPADAGVTTLLPPAFAAWTKTPAATVSAAEPKMSLVNANKAALEDDAPQRSETAVYTSAGRTLRIEAVEFGDYSGAWSAYTLLREPGLRDAKDLGAFDAIGSSSVLFVSGAVLAVAYPATAADLPALKALDLALPKVHGSAAQPPLLPTFLPQKALAPGSVRYALGAATYSAEGGVLPAAGIGWNKSAEAITATYTGHGADETLTLLLYPTPVIAETHQKSVQSMLPAAKVKRDAELVALASGPWPADAAQALVAGVHMNQLATSDRATQLLDAGGGPQFHGEVNKTFSLLSGIALLSAFLGGAAILLGLFFGGGRALLRVMQGKSAAVEPEFLSLHLANQNATPSFEPERK